MARGRPAKCPYCGGSSINKGYRKTKTMGKRRIKLCKDCCRKFTPRNQKPIEDSAVESHTEHEIDEAQPSETKPVETPAESVTEPKPLLNALDEEWTS